MAVTLTGTGGYFTRQGKIIGEFNRVTNFYGSSLTSAFNGIWAEFASAQQPAVQNLPNAVDTFRTTPQIYLTELVNSGINAQILQVDDDSSLTPYTLGEAIRRVIAQMKSTAQSINRPTVSSTPASDSGNLGNATLLTHTKNEFGDPLDMILAETVNFRCNADPGASYQASVVAVGQAQVSPYSHEWPAGSGCNVTFNVVDGNSDTLVTDGGFNQWTGTGNNSPVKWLIVNGAPGVTVFRDTNNGLRGLHAAKITSDGTSLTQLRQQITLEVNTVYCVSVYVKINTLTPTGTFRIAFCDNNGNIINDDTGSSLSLTSNLNGQIGTNYTLVSAFFATPRQLPSSTFVQIGIAGAVTAGRQISMSLAAVNKAVQLYAGGPFVTIVSKDLRTSLNDKWTCTYTNSLGKQSFARGMDRLYGMRNLGLYFPSSTSPTISDTLVTN
jgi:hypothetical protein